MTEQNKQPEESGLDLFRPTAEDERKGHYRHYDGTGNRVGGYVACA